MHKTTKKKSANVQIDIGSYKFVVIQSSSSNVANPNKWKLCYVCALLNSMLRVNCFTMTKDAYFKFMHVLTFHFISNASCKLIEILLASSNVKRYVFILCNNCDVRSLLLCNKVGLHGCSGAWLPWINKLLNNFGCFAKQIWQFVVDIP